ncbi:MAG: GNAT family N-acetyltransferase [Phycisphaerae bacterium]|nr:GNAT family N-acetyltransferase [Phycisphaerae bacterium]
MRFLIGGSSRDTFTRMQADSLYQRTLGADAGLAELWWARRGRTELAAAMIYHNVGRTGTLLASPAAAPDVDAQQLARLVGELSRAEIRRGLSMIQTLLPAEAKPELAMLGQAGYHRLAELAYMQLAVPLACNTGILPMSRMGVPPMQTPPADQAFTSQINTNEAIMPYAEHGRDAHAAHGQDARATFHVAAEFPARELEQIIRRSYEDSRDCPGLAGVRDLGDVVAGHRASGLFSPESWWIVHVEGQSAGCLLLNESLTGQDGEIVYLGVAPEFRRQGIARTMLVQAISHAQRVSWRRLTLAADSSNLPAVRLYESFQFAVSHRRDAWIFTRRDVAEGFPSKNRC